MITVIACTMRSSCIDNVFENYDRQLWKKQKDDHRPEQQQNGHCGL